MERPRSNSFQQDGRRPVPPPVVPPPSPKPSEMDNIRRNIETLVSHPSLEKEHALKVLSLFHDLENFMNDECVKRDVEIAKLGFEVEKVCLERDLLAPPPPPTEDSRRKGRWR